MATLAKYRRAPKSKKPADALSDTRTEPTLTTIKKNLKVKAQLPFDENQDFTNAKRGKIGDLDPLTVLDEDENVVWDLTQYDFQMEEDGVFPECPNTVNPSLWRQALLNTITGVFEVVPGRIFQVRGYDVSNMSAIKGETGWIIVDPLTTKELAQVALENLNREYNLRYPVPTSKHATVNLPVRAVIFTHSHADHFGGIWGLVDEEGADRPPFSVWGPENFLEEAVSENVISGNVIGRRSSYMYGRLLPASASDHVDCGLGKATATGEGGVVPVDVEIGGNGTQERIIDGVTVQFQHVPDSEAPAEIMFYFSDPELKAFCAAECVCHTFHNVLTNRGAKVRDSLNWAKYLHSSCKFFPDAEVIFASHHWPIWNKDENGDSYDDNRVMNIIKKQRDTYKYTHDQTMRLTNQGYTIQEVAEMIELPQSLAHEWFNRDYYGTVNHNAKAVYQRYVGWFDGNPASLHQLPPEAASVNYIRYMGGLASIMDKATTDYENGDYRWVAMVLNHVIFGTERAFRDGTLTPQERGLRRQARNLLASTYDQLGYQAESGPWRNIYLTGASELRSGPVDVSSVSRSKKDSGPMDVSPVSVFNTVTVDVMTLEMICDYLAIRINGPSAEQYNYIFNVIITPGSAQIARAVTEHIMTWYLENAVMNYDVGQVAAVGSVTATLTMTRHTLDRLAMGESGEDLVGEGAITIIEGQGGETEVLNFFGLLVVFNFWFNIVYPNIPTTS